VLQIELDRPDEPHWLSKPRRVAPAGHRPGSRALAADPAVFSPPGVEGFGAGWSTSLLLQERFVCHALEKPRWPLGLKGQAMFKTFSFFKAPTDNRNFHNEGILLVEWSRRLAPWSDVKLMLGARDQP
jgi:hypothetical protein